ncbi:MAG: DNA ligase (NAD(+)) LigA, partial [Hyphomicrobiaceae bacterium]
VGAVAHTKGFQNAKHSSPMLSLEKVTTLEQLKRWVEKRKQELNVKELALVVEPKVDGISVALTYHNGKLVSAVTRGDGTTGDVITKQVIAAKAAREMLDPAHRKGSFEVRGELVWPVLAFNRYNKLLESEGDEPLANPRNGCAGMMKRKDTGALEHADIRFVPFQLMDPAKCYVTEQGSARQWLRRVTSHLSPAMHSSSSYISAPMTEVEDVFAFCEEFNEKRGKLAFEIDGMVIKIADLRLAAKVGGTSHHPHWGVAYKFPPEIKETRLVNITHQIGKSGKITPVAQLSEVTLAGTVVQRASLHNFADVRAKDIRVHDMVYVQKAGDIIPQVIGVNYDRSPKRNKREVYDPTPHKCHVCHQPVVVEDVFVYCQNHACWSQRIERLKHFVSRRAMDIDGLGEALLEKLAHSDLVREPADLYTLRQKDLLTLDGVQKKSAANLISAIHASKDRGLARVLHGMSVRHVGTEMAKGLSQHFKSWEALCLFAAAYKGPKNMPNIEGMGELTAASVFKSLSTATFIKTMNNLEAAGVDLTDKTKAATKTSAITGKTFATTGKLETMTRFDLEEKVRAHGGKISGAVTAKTHYLVAGADGGQKLKQAEARDIPILTEDEFLKMISAKSKRGLSPTTFRSSLKDKT